MPWHIEKRGDEYCVIKDANGSSSGCHPTEDDANAQMRALYASEKEQKEGHMSDDDSTKMVVMTADAPTSFDELDDLRDAELIRRKFGILADDYLYVATNILYSPEVEDKGTALNALSQEFVGRISNLDADASSKSLLEKAVWSTAYKNDLPDSAFLYIEAGGKKDADGKTTPRSLRHFPVKDAGGKADIAHLRNAIAQASKAKNKDGEKLSDAIVKRVQSKARKMLENAQKDVSDTFWRSVVTKAKTFVSGSPDPDPDSPRPFFVWKDKDTDEFCWFAVYSNNFRDNDRPPEIIASDAHSEFVNAVDKGLWPMPELWLWHVPGSRVGHARMLAYDKETGFAMATGVFDPGMEHIAESLCHKGEDVSVSHGMPDPFIQRDSKDPSIITRYRTREISPLPAWAAANKSTGFLILNKEVVQMIPEQKAKFLADLGIDVDALTKKLEETKAALDAAGVDSKEVEDSADVGTQTDKDDETEDEPATEGADAAPEETSPAEPAPLSVEVVAAAVQVGVEAAMESVSGQLKDVSDRLAKLEKATDEFAEMTPGAASFGALLRSSVLGKTETKVDGRTKEGRDGPAETPPIQEGTTPFAIVDILKSGGDWRTAVADKMQQ